LYAESQTTRGNEAKANIDELKLAKFAKKISNY